MATSSQPSPPGAPDPSDAPSPSGAGPSDLSDGPAPVDLAGVEAVLLDMDGTLVDSHAVVERMWREWALASGVEPDAIVAVCHGATSEGTIRRFRPDLDEATVLAQAAAHMAAETLDVDGVVALPGAHEMLATLDALGLPWAVVTNADRPLALARLGAGGITPRELVTVDQVPVGKPDPAIYRLAAATIGVDIERCLVVEDSASGVAAGLAAGALVAAIGRDDADLRIDGLADLDALLRADRPTARATAPH